VILYVDTSALVKLYIEEPESPLVRGAAETAEAVTTHAIAYAEARATFARLHREARLSDAALADVKRAFEHDWERFVRIAAGEALLRRAGDLAEAFGLRGYDSVHLAAAEWARLQVGGPVAFSCFDGRLNRAAAVLGLEPLPSP